MTALNERSIDRVIEMAWEDRTPFEAIQFQFGISEKDVIRLMRANLKPRSFRMWRTRVNQGLSSKHQRKRSTDMMRFKSKQQRDISHNRPSKPR